jgi:hypothetical protein
MGIDRAIVAGEQARPVDPHQMRVVVLDGARPQDANLGGVDDPDGSHGG